MDANLGKHMLELNVYIPKKKSEYSLKSAWPDIEKVQDSDGK